MTRVATPNLAPPVDAETRQRARLELAMAASAAEQRNRPTYLLVIAAVLVIAALIAFLVSLGARKRAESVLAGERAAASEFQTASARIVQLRALAGDRPTISEPNDRIRSRIIAAAERAGMVGEPAGMTAAASLVPTVSQDPRTPGSADGTIPPMQRSKFRYENVRQPSLKTLLDWLNYAVEEIPGLEVYSITLKPEAGAWNLGLVTFTRWERVSP